MVDIDRGSAIALVLGGVFSAAGAYLAVAVLNLGYVIAGIWVVFLMTTVIVSITLFGESGGGQSNESVASAYASKGARQQGGDDTDAGD